MNSIRVLDRAVSEQIAAGEVVTRPAAVVKELVENCIDAGATSVVVEIVGNGLKSIRITDNGCGIPSGEVKTAFLRHATSKLTDAAQLDSIHTMGFRGEALPSIAAVSRVKMITRPALCDVGTEYIIEGGQEVSFKEIGCPEGTTVYVNDIFYNTPARMKFLKKDVSEGNAVQQTVEQLSLAYPNVSFSFIRDGKQTLFTPGTGLETALFAVLPRGLYTDMIPLSLEHKGYTVTGYVSAPHAARASRSFQYCYVNGRYVKNKTITAAAEEAYRSFMHRGSFPAFVISLETVPERVDVNVHPAKTEVRFSAEREVFSAVYSAVRSSILEYTATPVVENQSEKNTVDSSAVIHETALPIADRGFDQSVTPFAVDDAKSPTSEYYKSAFSVTKEVDKGQSFELFSGDVFKTEESSYDKPRVSSVHQNSGAEAYRASAAGGNWDLLFSLRHEKENEDVEAAPEPCDDADFPCDNRDSLEGFISSEGLKMVGEAFLTYIILEAGDSLIFMDKHAAHERALFEHYSQTAGNGRQILLEPILLELEANAKQVLLDNTAEVEKAGFLVEDFGDKTVAIREAPAFFSRKAAARAAEEMAYFLADEGGDFQSTDKLRLIQSVSCRAAIKAGDRTTREELFALAKRVISGQVPRFCPHGRPLYYTMSKKELDRRFDRA